MKVSELMVGYTPDDEFEGFATNDDWVLAVGIGETTSCLLYTSPSPRDPKTSRMPSSA